MHRVLIIGPCGSGKSTLSRELGQRLGLPVYHLDQLGWRPGWIETDRNDLRDQITTIVATDRWLIEGNYGSTLDLRLPRADTVVYLDFPIFLCVWRLLKRTVRYLGRTRPDMTDGCKERFDFEFFAYIFLWNWGPRRRTEEHLRGYEAKVRRLPSLNALKDWLKTL